MNSFQRFKERNKKHLMAQDQANSNFITNGYPSIKITNNEGVIKQAAVVNKQEKDFAYIYTNQEDILEIGSIWSAKTLHWLIAEEIITIKDVLWHKYLAFLCNINFDDIWGYFKGPEETYISITREKDMFISSNQKPILVLSENVLHFQDKIVIKNRGWIVQEYDAISTPGLVYYSLQTATVSKDDAAAHEGQDTYIIPYVENKPDFINQPEEISNNQYYVNSNQEITLNTTNGFFYSSINNLNILKRNATTVIFKIPFGISSVDIQVKDAEENIINYKYIVKD